MNGGNLYTMDTYVKSSKKEISQRKLEGLEKLSKIVQWGRKNPS